MKRFWKILLISFVLLMCMPGAMAAGEDEAEELVTTVVTVTDSSCTNASLLSAECWEDSWTCYGDQLDGVAAEIYAQMENVFLNDAMVLKDMLTNVGQVKCWMMDNRYTFTQNYSGQEELNALIGSAQSDAIKAGYAFAYDYPEYFWIRTDVLCSVYCSSDGRTATIEVEAGFKAQPSCDSWDEINALRKQVEDVIDGLLKETEDMVVVQRLAYWDNWLAENNHYNHTAAMNTNTYLQIDDTPWSIVGSLLDEYSPVCEGYAKAFQLLCHKIGVPCLQVCNTGHMWTAVYLNEAWYLCDPTWNDPTILNSDRDYSSRTYFLTGELKSHTPAMQYLIAPEIHSETYFTDWDLADGQLTGCEKGGGDLLIALYDKDGKMLACDFCPRFYWSKMSLAGITYDGYMYVSPEFNETVLAKAVKAVRFRLYGGAWAAAGEKLLIS